MQLSKKNFKSLFLGSLVAKDSFTTVPLIKNLTESRQLANQAVEGFSNIAKSKARLAAARPTGQVPGIRTGGRGVVSAKTASMAAGTSLAGIAGVVGAGLVGAAAIHAASKKTKATQEKHIRQTMATADDLIKNIKKNRKKKKIY